MAKLVKESLNEDHNDVTEQLNKLLMPYGLVADLDFKEPGDSYGYDGYTYSQYSFRSEQSAYEYLSLEVLEDENGERTFQFYYDANPILTGDPGTLSPDHQPFEEIGDYIDQVVEEVENAEGVYDEDEGEYEDEEDELPSPRSSKKYPDDYSEAAENRAKETGGNAESNRKGGFHYNPKHNVWSKTSRY